MLCGVPMAVMNDILGKLVYLIAVDADDAEFTLNLRNVGRASETMPKIDNTLEQQKEWIKHQRTIPHDYFFKIRTYDNKDIGTVGFYDIDEVNNVFEIGRYIANGLPLENIEGLLLAINTCFEKYNVNKILLHVLKNNKSVYHFWKKFGAKDIKDIDLKGHPATEMILYKEDYIVYRDKIYSLITND